jgi:hypothetical protein
VTRRRARASLRTVLPALALLAALVTAPAGLAAPPSHAATPLPPDLEFAPGEACAHGILVRTWWMRIRSSEFPALPDGTVRLKDRGAARSTVTDLETGASVEAKGGSRLAFRNLPDGTLVVDGTGSLLVWYFEGDPSELAPGVYLVNGHARETYAPDGTLVGATFDGRARNLCEMLGG